MSIDPPLFLSKDLVIVGALQHYGKRNYYALPTHFTPEVEPFSP